MSLARANLSKVPLRGILGYDMMPCAPRAQNIGNGYLSRTYNREAKSQIPVHSRKDVYTFDGRLERSNHVAAPVMF